MDDVKEYFSGLARLRYDADAEAPEVTLPVHEALAKAGKKGGQLGGLACGERKRASACKAIETRWKRWYAKKGLRWIPPSQRKLRE
jgi:hypothetical protein